MMIRSSLLLATAGTLGAAEPVPAPAPAPQWQWLSDWTAKMLPITPQRYVAYHTGTAVTVDGKLDDAAWKSAAWTQEFVDIEGDAKPKPRFRTRAKMAWDDTYFYIAAEMEEPHVWGTLTQHDAVIFYDPDFEVFIDPNSDSHEYYEFEMNALNTGWDLFLPKPYKDGGPAKNEWEIPGLKTAVHVRGTLNDPSDTDEGWDVEIAIPWKVLAEHAHKAAPPQEGDQWRTGFSRVEWQTNIKDGKYVKRPNTPENNWIWSAQGVIDMHRPERWGYVQFSRKAPGTAKFVEDSSAPARNTLQTVYYAQKSFFDKHRRWAATLEELEFKLPAMRAPGVSISAPVLEKTADGYTCRVDLTLADQKPQRWQIRHDSLIQQVPTP
jgi:hypothetical protein